MKVIVRSPDEDTDFFYIVAGASASEYINPLSVHNLPRLRTSNVDRS